MKKLIIFLMICFIMGLSLSCNPTPSVQNFNDSVLVDSDSIVIDTINLK